MAAATVAAKTLGARAHEIGGVRCLPEPLGRVHCEIATDRGNPRCGSRLVLPLSVAELTAYPLPEEHTLTNRTSFHNRRVIALCASSVFIATALAGAPALADDNVKLGREVRPQMKPRDVAPPQAPAKPRNVAPPPAPKPAGKPAAKAPAKPTEVARPTAKPPTLPPPAPKPAARPAAKPAEVARPAAKPPTLPPPASKPAARPAAKPAAKPVEVARPAAKPPTLPPPAAAKPREVTRPTEIKPREVARPTEAKPREVARPTEIKPREVARPTEIKPREVARPTEIKPREVARPQVRPAPLEDDAPIRPVARPSEPTRVAPTERPIEAKPKPPARPVERGEPDVTLPRGGSDRTRVDSVSTIEPTELARNDANRASRTVADSVPGADARRDIKPRGDSSGGGTVVNNNGQGTNVQSTTTINSNTYNNYSYNNTTFNSYVTNVGSSRHWATYPAWWGSSSCAPWYPYGYRDGLSISLGFGSGGFGFSLFYGSSTSACAPIWGTPWWDCHPRWNHPVPAWTCAPTSLVCGTPWQPYWRGSVWFSSCRSAWHGWNLFDPWWCHRGWSECAWPSYSISAPVVFTSYAPAPTIIVTSPPPEPSLPNPSALWTFLAEGYDRYAEDGFAVLAAAEPGERAWFVGQGFARAFRGETAWAADILRQAFHDDPASVMRTSNDPRFVARLEALERSLEPLANAATPNPDALLVTAASAAARGDLNGAYFVATTAQADGDRSAGTARLVTYLRAELRVRGL